MTIKEIQKIVDSDYVHGDKNEKGNYDDKLKAALKRRGWDEQEVYGGDAEHDIVHFDLWSDTSFIAVKLANLLLEEREERKKIIEQLKRDYKQTIEELEGIEYE